MARNMAVRAVGRLVLVRQSGNAATEEDWDAYLKLPADRRDDFSKLKVLIMSDGGGPTADQRKSIAKVLDNAVLRIAVVCDSIKTRFIVSSLSWFNPEMQSFTKKDIREAYKHLALDASEQVVAKEQLAEMEQLIQ